MTVEIDYLAPDGPDEMVLVSKQQLRLLLENHPWAWSPDRWVEQLCDLAGAFPNRKPS